MQAPNIPADTYLPDQIYFALRKELVKLVSEAFDREGTDPETEVVHALGEVGGVWPESVLDDAERAAAAA